MVSMALESFSASPFSNACSLVSAFTICTFNTVEGVKVTQNRPKIIFLKNRVTPGYLLSHPGINKKFTHNKTNKHEKAVIRSGSGRFRCL